MDTVPTPFPTLYPPVSTADLRFSCAAYAAVSLVLLVLFAILRRCLPAVYYPKFNNKDLSLQTNEPPRTFLSWLQYVLSTQADEDILHQVGFDSYTAVRVVKFGLLIFGPLTLFVFVIFVPIYATQPQNEYGAGIELISLSNVPAGNTGVFFLCVLGVCAISAYVMWLLQREYAIFVQMRHVHYLANAACAYTVLVERVPESLASSEALRRYFEAVVGDVLAVEIVPEATSLDKLRVSIEERDDVLEEIERAQFDQGNSEEPLKHIVFSKSTRERVYCCGCISLTSRFCCHGLCCYLCYGGEYVKSTLYYAERLEDLNQLIPVLQEEIISEQKGRSEGYGTKSASQTRLRITPDFRIPSSAAGLRETNSDVLEEAMWLLDSDKQRITSAGVTSAFVTFKTQLSSTVTSRIPLNEVETSLFVRQAPQPEDVLWENLGIEKKRKAFLSALSVILYVTLLLSFGALTAAISAATQLESLREGFPGLNTALQNYPWLAPLISQIAPLALVIAFSLVPPIQMLIIQLHRPSSNSKQDSWFFIYYFTFQVIQIFLFYQISGSIYNLLFQVYKDPWQAVRILAQQIPTNATFYMQYILLRAFVLMPLEWLRVADLTVAYLVRPIFCGTSQTKKERRNPRCGCNTIEYPGDPWHAKSLSQIVLIISMGLVYSIMAPLVVPIVTFYLAVTLMTLRNGLEFVYIPLYESGGVLWPLVASCVVFSVVLLQCTMMGIFLFNQQAVATGLMIPTIALTLMSWCCIDKTYNKSLYSMPLATAKSFDIQRTLDRKKTTGDDDLGPGDLYRHPLLRRRSTQNITSDITLQ